MNKNHFLLYRIFFLAGLVLYSMVSWAQTSWTSANDGAGSGLDADLLQGYDGSTYIGKRGQTYYHPDTWLQLSGGYGFYAPTIKDAHFMPNTISNYGQFAVYSNAWSGWGGLLLGKNISSVHLMSNTDNYDGGFYYQDISRWELYFSKTANYVSIGGTNTAANGSLYAGQAIFNGNVLIGKASQSNTSYRLDVNGNVRANKVVVNTTGADFVFDSVYSLTRPEDLGRYIRIHHHLPGISTAIDMQKDGVDVEKLQTKLLQKVEELTLYMIQQEQEIKALKAQVATFQAHHRKPSQPAQDPNRATQ